jgi:L-ascorbate metabolism protein UlaG (beta-lactamase superfamily)
MKRFTCGCLVPLFTALLPGEAAASDCDPRLLKSPQFAPEDCVFRNPPNPDGKVPRSLWAIYSRMAFEKKVGTVPIDAIPVHTLSRAALDALDTGANHIIRLGHSSLLFKLHGKWWLVDPVFGPRASPLSWIGPKRFHEPPVALHDVPPIEGLVLSHDHYDHLDAPTIAVLKDRVQRYFVPLGVGRRLQEWGVPADRIEEMDWWEERQWGEVTVTAAPAQHFSGRTLWDRNRTLWASWSLRSKGEHIFYSGDSGYFPGFKEIGQRLGSIDIALMENGAYNGDWPTVHMSPEETVQAFQDLGAHTLFLVHNSTFDLAYHRWQEPLERVTAIAQQRGIALATPEIGEVLTLGRPRVNRKWWDGLR